MVRSLTPVISAISILRGIPLQQGLKPKIMFNKTARKYIILRGIPLQQGLKPAAISRRTTERRKFSEVFHYNKD